MEPLGLLILLRGIERLILASAGIVSIVVGARLFKVGVYDHFEAAVERGDVKVRVTTLAPGTVFGIAGIVLCCIGYFYGLKDVSVEQAMAQSSPPPPATEGGGGTPATEGGGGAPAPPPTSRVTIGSFGSEQLGFFTDYLTSIRNEVPGDEQARASRVASANYLILYCSNQANALDEMKGRIEKGEADAADVLKEITEQREVLGEMIAFLTEAARDDADLLTLTQKGEKLLQVLKKGESS